MSKITICGGDIIEKIGGKDLSFAKGEIINNGSSVIQTGKENGVSYGVNKEKINIHTCFVFVNNENKFPIYGLEVILKDRSGNIIKKTTNKKGIVALDDNYKGPFVLLYSRHIDVYRSTNKVEFKAIYDYTISYTFDKYEEKIFHI